MFFVSLILRNRGTDCTYKFSNSRIRKSQEILALHLPLKVQHNPPPSLLGLMKHKYCSIII